MILSNTKLTVAARLEQDLANYILQTKPGNTRSSTIYGCVKATVADVHSCRRDCRA